MKNTRILLIAKECASKKIYVEMLSKVGVTFDIATSFAEASGMARNIPYNGLLVDVLTLIRADQNEKSIALECMN